MPPNPDSILDTVKKTLGLDNTDTTFDLDVTMFINSAFGSLQQIGLGPDTGFAISDNTTMWWQYVTRQSYLGLVKSYVFMKVKLAFDPPDSRFALPAYEKMLEELTWRINIAVETPSVIPLWWLLNNLPDFPSEAFAGDYGYDSETSNVYVNDTKTGDAYWWDLTGLNDFPNEALLGEIGFSSVTGEVWRKTA